MGRGPLGRGPCRGRRCAGPAWRRRPFAAEDDFQRQSRADCGPVRLGLSKDSESEVSSRPQGKRPKKAASRRARAQAVTCHIRIPPAVPPTHPAPPPLLPPAHDGPRGLLGRRRPALLPRHEAARVLLLEEPPARRAVLRGLGIEVLPDGTLTLSGSPDSAAVVAALVAAGVRVVEFRRLVRTLEDFYLERTG